MRFIRFIYFGATGLFCLHAACTSPVETNIITTLTGTQELYADRQQKTHLAWAPDNSLIAYQTSMDTLTNSQLSTIFVYDLQQDSVRDVTSNAHDKSNSSPTFSADSKSIIFSRENRLHKLSLSDEKTFPLTPSDTPPQYHPAVSPDGQYIVCDDGQDIYIVSSDSGALNNLSSAVTIPLENPTWSPDGLKIACQTPDSLVIFVFNNDEIVLAFSFAGHFTDISWARQETPPFGSAILFRNGPGIATINPSTGDIFDAFDLRKDVESFCWAPNGHDIAFTTPYFIYRAPLFTTIERK